MQQATIWRVIASAAVIAGTAALSPSALAQQGDPSTDVPQQGTQQGQDMEHQGAMQDTGSQRSTAQLMTKTATVQKIDKANQTVTLKDPSGQITEFKTGPNVSLDRLKVGDQVSATYYEEVAVALKKPGQGQAAPSMTQKTTQRGGVAVKQTTLTARVLSVDAANNTVMVHGPRGTSTLHVQDPDVQAQLKQIKAGDNVEVTYTQALAVSIEPKK
jgi:Cu/Ag efflux protein CusF